MICNVMAIVNVTPDSFSDGGLYYRPEEALRRAHNAVAEGAAILDFGAESTRPGATPLTAEREIERLRPVLEPFASTSPVPVSVDTYHPETAAFALDCGATILNCVYPEPVPAMLALLDRHPRAELVLPWTCLDDARLDLAPYRDRLYLDPMIGFGTTREEDVALLHRIPAYARRGRVLVGASRKRLVKKLTGEKRTGKNLGGNLGLAVWCALHGAQVVRVHDVAETVQALKVVAALEANPLSSQAIEI